MNPLVSVLIRTKNRKKLLQEAVLSVANQTYQPIEVIIVNDGGEKPDNCISELDLPQKEFNIRLYNHETSLGRSEAANTAMQHASGEFFLFLDDDDLLTKNHLKLLVNLVKYQDPKKIIGAYSGTQCVETTNGDVKATTGVYNEQFDAIKLAYSNYLPIHSVLFHASIYQKGCRFNPKLDLYEDWNFWLQVIQHGELLHEPSITALYRVDESGIGQPGQTITKDFHDEWFLFIKESKGLLSPQQINHLVFSARELENIQRLLEEKTTLLNQSTREANLLQEHLDNWEKVHLRSQSEIENQKKTNSELTDTIKARVDEIKNLKFDIENLRNQNSDKVKQLNKANQELRFLQNYPLKSQIKNKIQYELSRTLKPLKNLKTAVIPPTMKIYQYIKAFLKLILTGQFFLAYQRTKGFLQRLYYKRKLRHVDLSNSNDQIYILATRHTLFVAELIQKSLHAVGKKNVMILDPETTVFSGALHFVICPQMFEKLPNLYIAFQMEQSVSSRWFNQDYFRTLEHALAVMDYSKTNIRYLQEEGKLHYKQVFWTPISNIRNFRPNIQPKAKPEYDVIFYGDPNNERRQTFLKYLKQHFKVLVVSEVFGDDLYRQLIRGQVIVNIHYYEGALLETTRIYECLSLGLNIISEASSDQTDHNNLEGLVTFTPIGDMQAMKVEIESQLTSVSSRKINQAPEDIAQFQYYFARMLMAIDLIPAIPESIFLSYVKPSTLKNRVALTLPETYARHDYIKNLFPEASHFSGLRHFDGWVGAASSFKYLALAAKEYNISHLEVCEDDVELKPNFDQHYQTVQQFLFSKLTNKDWDIFCGLIADLHQDVQIIQVYEYQGMTFIELDKMTSMVFNIYNQNAIDLLANWDESNRDIDSNTIDRYLENSPLKVITTLPYLVSHLPEHTSSIWHFENSTYDDLIATSEQKLQQKLDEYLVNNNIVKVQ